MCQTIEDDEQIEETPYDNGETERIQWFWSGQYRDNHPGDYQAIGYGQLLQIKVDTEEDTKEFTLSEGYFQQGHLEGYGRDLQHFWGPEGSSSECYVGEFRRGEKNGIGKYTPPDGKVKEGQFRSDKYIEENE